MNDNENLDGDDPSSSKYFYQVTEQVCLDHNDAPLLQDAAYYMRLALAVYGHLMYLYEGDQGVANCCCSCSSCWTLTKGSFTKTCRRCCKSNHSSDNNKTSYRYGQNM
jgi:hypothetical protein